MLKRVPRRGQEGEGAMGEVWTFTDPPAMAVVTLRRISEQGYPILLVIHEADEGGWQFLDGEDVTEDDAIMVSLHHIIASDTSLRSLAALPPGWQAQRSDPDHPWQTQHL